MREFVQLTAMATILSVLMMFSFGVIEPGMLQAQSASDDVVVSLTVDSGITISSPSDITMSPNIGVSQDSSIGNATWTVTTNDVNGYTLAVNATSSPAMQGQNGQDPFADYSESTSGVPDSWSVDSGNYEFGFSAYGDHVATEYGSDTTCGSGGTPSSNLKYEGFTTSDEQIASHNSTTTTSGEDTTLCLAAAQNSTFAESGSYEATIVATATTQ